MFWLLGSHLPVKIQSSANSWHILENRFIVLSINQSWNLAQQVLFFFSEINFFQNYLLFFCSQQFLRQKKSCQKKISRYLLVEVTFSIQSFGGQVSWIFNHYMTRQNLLKSKVFVIRLLQYLKTLVHFNDI